VRIRAKRVVVTGGLSGVSCEMNILPPAQSARDAIWGHRTRVASSAAGRLRREVEQLSEATGQLARRIGVSKPCEAIGNRRISRPTHRVCSPSAQPDLHRV
jgi:hypothetical protein